MMKVDDIIKKIEEIESISVADSFRYAQICATELRNNESEGRKFLIYILDNFNKIPEDIKEIWFDIMEMAGFYPYLEKERGSPSTIDGQIRKEFHLSQNLENIYFHEEQKVLKYILGSDKNLIVSAPTSFGKSLLIEEIVASKKYKNIVIIQPTLALLDETRKKLKKYKEIYKIIVKTSQEPAQDKGNLFLLTAERVMEYPNLPKIDFLIIDEFYKLSQKRDDERAYILNNAFYKLLKEFNPKFYLLGPNIDDISKGFKEKYNAIFYKTDYSLVESKIVDIYSQHKEKFDKPRKYKEYKEQILFNLLTSNEEQFIIYCSSPRRVRELSWKFCNYLKNNNFKNLDDELPLVEWIKEYVSPHWNLIELLNYGIGINDGALIKHINSSIVDYFNEEKLKYLFCTTTLIEGVNTGAKNIVFFDKTKGNRKPIDFFDYSNIKGRAGRFTIHYIGKIYNFNPPPTKNEKLIIDISFYQQNPIEDEVLITLEKNDIQEKVKNTEQYKKLITLSGEECELFKRNGVSVWGQKRILEQLFMDIDKKINLITWNGLPNYQQLTYVISLSWENLLRPGETTRPMTKKRLIKVAFDYTVNKDIQFLIKSTYTYYKEKNCFPKYDDTDLFNEAIREAFNIFRHWFQFKLPKWLSVVDNIQKFICEKKNVSSGNYTYYASLLENDFIQDELSILLEYGIPKTAIEKIKDYINFQRLAGDEDLIKKVIELAEEKNDLFLRYEIEKIKGNL